MNKHVKVNLAPNKLMRNFQDWSKNAQQVTADAIINESLNSGRQVTPAHQNSSNSVLNN